MILTGLPLRSCVTPASQGSSGEAGVKFDLLDDRLAVTADAFHMFRSNVVRPSGALATPASNDVVMPQVAGQGAEFGLAGDSPEG